MTGALMRYHNKPDTGRHGRLAEPKIAKRLGGKTTLGSGAIDRDKGDINLPEFLIEAKTTLADSISIKQDWLLKIYQEALEKHKEPAMAINFVNEAGRSEKRQRWVAIPEHVFISMLDELRESREHGR